MIVAIIRAVTLTCPHCGAEFPDSPEGTHLRDWHIRVVHPAA